MSLTLFVFIFFSPYIFCNNLYFRDQSQKVSQYSNRETIQNNYLDIHKREVSHFDSPSASSYLNRNRRDADDKKCQQIELKFLDKLKTQENNFHSIHTFIKENKYSMQLVYAGNKVILVATTEEFSGFAKPSTLYRSIDNGKSFKNITDKIQNVIIRAKNGIQKHQHIASRIYVFSYGQTKVNTIMHISEDLSTPVPKFDRYDLPFILDKQFVFHPDKKKEFVLARSHSWDLWFSRDGGKSDWTKIASNVVYFKWATPESNPNSQYTVFITVDPKKSRQSTGFFGLIISWYSKNDYIFKRRNLDPDQNLDWEILLTNVYTFGIEGKFIYASLRTKDDSSARKIKVSTSGGDVFNDVLLPSIAPEQFYSILDMSEGMVFVHVDNPSDTGHGTLYMSDSTGIVFSVSLKKHLYPNHNDLTDFYKVQSMRGVYIASQLSADNSIHTLISYDRGGVWKPITRPAGVPCKDETKACYLQIHNRYSQSQGLNVNPPLSVPSAPGIIIVHGHVASALQTSEADIFITSDGGYTWAKALDGPHKLQIADNGGLIVAIPVNTRNPTMVKFSTDEGRCWHNYNFTDQVFSFTGFLTEPGNHEMTVSIWGYTANRTWVVHTIDFATIITKPCNIIQDYETWVPHSDGVNKGCFLGQKETFHRMKKYSWCSNGHSYVSKIKDEPCTCTPADYDCDYGYKRAVNSENCVKDELFKGVDIDICNRSHEEEVITKGYRKIPGDKCKDGFKPAGERILDLHKSCKSQQALISKDTSKKPVSASHSILIVTVFLISILLVLVVGAFLYRRYVSLRSSKVRYRYSMLKEGETDADIEDALLHNTALFDDEVQEVDTKHSASSNKPVKSLSGGSSNGGMKPSLPDTSLISSKREKKYKSFHDESDDDLLE